MSSLSNDDEELKHYESEDDEFIQLNPGDESECGGSDCPCLRDEDMNTTRQARRVINNKHEDVLGYCDAAIAAEKITRKCDACGWLMKGRSCYDFGMFNNYCFQCGDEINIDTIYTEVFDTECKKLIVFGFNPKTGLSIVERHGACGMLHANAAMLLHEIHWDYRTPGKMYTLFKALERGRAFPNEVTKLRVSALVQEFVTKFHDAIMAKKIEKEAEKRERALLRYNEAQSMRATRKRAITTFVPATAGLSDQEFDAMFPAKVARIKDEAHRIEIDTITAIPPDQLTPGDIFEFVKLISK